MIDVKLKNSKISYLKKKLFLAIFVVKVLNLINLLIYVSLKIYQL